MRDRAELARSFGSAARTYDRYRIGPPARAVDWLLPSGCASVLDLAAGTGLLTRRLIDRVDEVLAVEPDARMRAVYAENHPRATAVDGTAENIPLPSGRVDAVLVSAAWHWMDPAAALPEIARVLRPGGTFGVLWTRRDRRQPWVAELDAFVREITGAGDEVATHIDHTRREVRLPEGALFTESEPCVLHWREPMTVEAVVGMYTTYSRFLIQPEGRKREIASRIEERVRALAGTRSGGETLELPMACHCRRLSTTARRRV